MQGSDKVNQLTHITNIIVPIHSDVIRAGQLNLARSRVLRKVSVDAKVNGKVTRDASVLQASFELHELTHEVEVGRDDVAVALDEVEGLHHGEARAQHDVSDGDGCRTRHARHTMHQHTSARTLHVICSQKTTT